MTSSSADDSRLTTPRVPLPLEGITVVSLEQAVAAPFASRQLADLGARVIKIERPGAGDFARGYDRAVLGESSYFVWLNRSKESLTLDVKSESGRQVLARLLGIADVFLHNLGPGAADRLGLGAEILAADYPALIQCRVSGYGIDGAWRDRKAYDLLVQAEAGLLSITGTDESIARVGISVADISAGMYAFAGILAALHRRTTTQFGGEVNVSLFDALAEWMGSPAYYTMYGGESPARMGAKHATIAPYGAYRTADGEEIVLSVQNQPEWERFCPGFLEQPDLTNDARFATNHSRCDNREELDGIVLERVSALSTSEAIRLLEGVGVAVSVVRTMADFAEHPVLTSRNRWTDVDSPGGSVRALLPPVDLPGSTPRMDPVPALGAHTDELLREVGFDDGEIRELHDSRVV
jgi:itaconate CoA-transferase